MVRESACEPRLCATPGAGFLPLNDACDALTVTTANQKIIRIRREYNAWVADESLEDYALRYTPHSFRKWSEWRVANTAMGGISFLALEAIGAVMALNYGFTNALWAILAATMPPATVWTSIC